MPVPFGEGHGQRWREDKPIGQIRSVDLQHGYISVHFTFIKAFESSPVHCLNPRPSGNRRRPGKDGAAAILPGY